MTVTLVGVAILAVGAAVVADATNGQLAIPAFAVVVLVPALLAVRSPRVPSLLARVIAVAVGTAVGMTAYFAYLYRCQTGGYISFCDWTSNALGWSSSPRSSAWRRSLRVPSARRSVGERERENEPRHLLITRVRHFIDRASTAAVSAERRARAACYKQ